MSQARGIVRGLGKLARQALAESSEAAAGKRHASSGGHGAPTSFPTPTQTGARYSPNQFSKAAPMDRSGTWIPKNPFIESWVYRRDKFEKEFSWNLRTSVELFYYVGGITVGFYALSVWATRHTDARNNYPKRELLFSESKTGFVLPDEREW